MNNQSLRSEPFLWIHLAGVVVFPLFVGLTMVGLSLGNSYSFILELVLLAGIGIFPVWLMQLTRPFDIFSILLLSLKPEALSDRQRVILSLFKTFKQKFWSTIAALLMLALLWLVYRLSPLAIGIIDFLPPQRFLGLTIAGISFFASNLFLQIPLSVLLVLRTKESRLSAVQPSSIDEIQSNFTVPGIKLNKILWFIKPETNSLEIT